MTQVFYPHLLSPGNIGKLALRNRIVVTAMGVNFAEPDGVCSERIIAYHEEQARGGAALVITGVAGVAHPVGRVIGWQVGISEDRFIPGLARVAEAVHRHGAKAAVQLHHGGQVAGDSCRDGHPLWGPSMPGAMEGDFLDGFLLDELTAMARGMSAAPQIKIMTQDDIALVVRQFAEGARRAKQAGFDGVEIHGGHGYLLSSFLSAKSNQRTDEYGGNLANRARFLLAVLQAVRAEMGPDFAVWVKLDSREVGKEGGITVEDAKLTARLIEAAGADAITVTTYHDNGQGKLHSGSHTPHEPASNVPASAEIKKVLGIPVIASGRIEPAVGDAAIAAGQFDFLAMGRKLLADPALPRKLAAGKTEEIRPCIYCYTCISAIYTGESTRCAVNADLGFEYIRIAEAAPRRSAHVVVVGGGPAGMASAYQLAHAGHRVTLLESGPRLGGTLRFASLAYVPNERLLDWLIREVEAANIEVRLATPATPELLHSLRADAVIVASGAVRGMPDIPGSEQAHVFSGDDMRKMVLGESSASLARKTSWLTRAASKIGAATGLSSNLEYVRKATHAWMPLGKNIVIIGGELVGLELAEFLSERGRVVTVVDDAPRLGAGLLLVRRLRLLAQLREHGIALFAGASDLRIEADSVSFTDVEGKTQQVPADHVIVAKGAVGDTTLADQLRAAGLQVLATGDCTGVGYIEGAMRGAQTTVQALTAALADEREIMLDVPLQATTGQGANYRHA